MNPRRYLVVVLSVVLTGCVTPSGGSSAVHAAEQTFDVRPAERALERLLPSHHRQVRLRALGGSERFRASGKRGRITVEGTSPAVLLTGFNAYLKQVAKADISWTGQQLRLPAKLPSVPGEIAQAANVPHRFALNDTDDGYTGAYRSWAEWERKIDVLAMHGINEVLMYVGQDRVYYDTFREFGYSEKEMRSWIPAPAHQPWWLLQNLHGFGGPVSQQLLARRTALAQKIAGRLRELGMTPVLPGYFGTVPPDFPAKNPGARVVPQGIWYGFQRPDWLDPRNEHFPKVAAAFYRHQRALYGDSAMYKMDLLHEGGSAGDVPVAEATKHVEKALRTAHPSAIWAILGWRKNPPPEIIEAADRRKMLVVDGLSDRFPEITDREKDWKGTPYAFGSIWNFGGHTTLGANAPDWVSLYPKWLGKEGSALRGIAMMPEASDNNPAALELFTELAWTAKPIDREQWFNEFAVSRYGAADPNAAKAWQVLRETAYGTNRADRWSEQADGLFAARPSLTATRAGRWSPQQTRYDAAEFTSALKHLLNVAPQLRGSSAYRYDLVDVARQVLSNRSRTVLPKIKAAYDAKDRSEFAKLTRNWLATIRLMDRLVATEESYLLGRWIRAARAQGTGEAEKDRLEYDARSLLTTWGTRSGSEAGLRDYGNREWSGLLGDLYHKRWKLYFGELKAALDEGRPPKEIDWFAIDDAWAHETRTFPATPRGDGYRFARQIAGRG